MNPGVDFNPGVDLNLQVLICTHRCRLGPGVDVSLQVSLRVRCSGIIYIGMIGNPVLPDPED